MYNFVAVPLRQSTQYEDSSSTICHPAGDINPQAADGGQSSLPIHFTQSEVDFLDVNGFDVSVLPGSSVYSIQTPGSNVDFCPSASAESGNERIVSSYVEDQIDHTIKWVEDYTYSPEFIETVTPPIEDHDYSDKNIAVMTPPVEYETDAYELEKKMTPSVAAHAHFKDSLHPEVPLHAEHIHIGILTHSVVAPTRKPSKLSKKVNVPQPIVCYFVPKREI